MSLAEYIYQRLRWLAFPHVQKLVLARKHRYRTPATTRRENHSPKGRARRKRYERSAKGIIAGRAKCMRRWARKCGARCGDPAAVRKVYARAEELRNWFDVVVDHRIPLIKGGAHASHNLQIIYATENTRKNARLDYKPKVIFS